MKKLIFILVLFSCNSKKEKETTSFPDESNNRSLIPNQVINAPYTLQQLTDSMIYIIDAFREDQARVVLIDTSKTFTYDSSKNLILKSGLTIKNLTVSGKLTLKK